MSSQFKKAELTDLLKAVVLTSCFVVLAQVHAAYPGLLSVLLEDETSHLGAEYDNIASAIYAGQGFSNPFHDETGPTAWMPPVLPYLMAAAYWLASGDRDFVIAVVCGMHWLGVVWHVWLVLRTARRLKLTALGLALTVLWLVALFFDYFQSAHDAGLLLVCTAALTELGLWLLKRIEASGLPTSCSPEVLAFGESERIENATLENLALEGRAKKLRPALLQAVGWGTLGGCVAMCSPVLGGVWGLLTVAFLFYKAPTGSWQPTVVAVILAIGSAVFVVTPWTLRSYLTLGKVLPIKSNGGYELWQSQVIDGDGVLDGATCRDHPWVFDGKERQAYKRLGEIEFIRTRGAAGLKSISSYPVDYLRRVLRRAFAALLVWHRFDPEPETWALGIPDLLRHLLHPLPLVSLLALLFFRVPFDATLRLATFIWLATLMPYIFISYYERYALPLLGMKLILVLYGSKAVRDRVAGKMP